MKNNIIVLFCGLLHLFQIHAQGKEYSTINMNNIDCKMPLYLYKNGNLAPVDTTYVMILSGPAGGALSPVTPIGVNSPLIKLSQPGYFDAGVGIIPGIGPNYEITVEVIAWQSFPVNPGTYEGATFTGSHLWYQFAGSWDSSSGTTPTGPSLAMTRPVLITGVPEPKTVALGLLGGAAMITNQVIKLQKTKKATTPEKKNADKIIDNTMGEDCMGK